MTKTHRLRINQLLADKIKKLAKQERRTLRQEVEKRLELSIKPITN